MKKRKFVEGELIHTYQRTISGFNIFYELEDYLVYYTIYSTLSVKYNIVVYGLCLMIDHIHSLCTSSDKATFSRFMSPMSSSESTTENTFGLVRCSKEYLAVL